MLRELKNILNSYPDNEIDNIGLWINGGFQIKTIIIDEDNIDLITGNMTVNLKEED